MRKERRKPIARRSTTAKVRADSAARPVDRRVRSQLKEALEAALAKKALDALVLDVRELAGFTDYFLICHGTNPRQIQTIADEVERVLQAKDKLRPSHIEGYQNGEWVVLDYLDFVVHIFSQKSREFYALERIWQKAPRLHIEGSA